MLSPTPPTISSQNVNTIPNVLYNSPLKINFYLEGLLCFYDLFSCGEQVVCICWLEARWALGKGSRCLFSTEGPWCAPPAHWEGKKPAQFGPFLSGFELGVSSRRELSPCTESWGNLCQICGRFWLLFEHILPPACHTHSSVFHTKSQILEENLLGLSKAKNVKVRGCLLGHSCCCTQPPH